MTKHIIGWATITGHKGRWLHINAEGAAFMVPDRLKASRFDREEVNTILLALFDHGRWSMAGADSYPMIEDAIDAEARIERAVLLKNLLMKR